MLDSTREKIRQKYTQAEIGRYMGSLNRLFGNGLALTFPKAGNSVMSANEVGSYPA